MKEKNIVEQYVTQVRKVMYLPAKEKKEALEELKQEIQFYIDKNPQCTLMRIWWSTSTRRRL